MQRIFAIAVFSWTVVFSLSANAADKVVAAVIGSYNAFVWPVEIAFAKGFYADQSLDIDIIFVPSAPTSLQQLAAGSLDLSISTGLVDPLRLVARGASVALGRIELRISPYVLVASHDIKDIAALKGKTVAIGSKADITHVLIEKMLASAKLGLDDIDLVYSGSTASRYSALKTGAIAASLLAPPLTTLPRAKASASLAWPAITPRTCPLPARSSTENGLKRIRMRRGASSPRTIVRSSGSTMPPTATRLFAS